MRVGYSSGYGLGDNGSILCEDRARVLALCYWQGETAAAHVHSGTLTTKNRFEFKKKRRFRFRFPFRFEKLSIGPTTGFRHQFRNSFCNFCHPFPLGTNQIRFATVIHSRRLEPIKAFFIP